jgi:hypothetical protein
MAVVAALQNVEGGLAVDPELARWHAGTGHSPDADEALPGDLDPDAVPLRGDMTRARPRMLAAASKSMTRPEDRRPW